jgi:hypothetical protein
VGNSILVVDIENIAVVIVENGTQASVFGLYRNSTTPEKEAIHITTL